MKWFQHQSKAHTDAKLQKVLIRYGFEGYGLYWYCIESICQNLEPRLTFELEEDSEILAHIGKMDSRVVEEIMLYMVNIGLFTEADGVVVCRTIARYLGDSLTRNPKLKTIIQEEKGKTGEGVAKGYVYFIESGEQIKIGYSANPWSRVKDIRSDDHRNPALLAQFKGTIQDEKIVHRLFATENVEGEWFKSTPILKLVAANVRKGTASTLGEVRSLVEMLRSNDVVQLSHRQDRTGQDRRGEEKDKTTTVSPSGACEVEILFDLFYSAYPKKVGKAAAIKAWNKLNPSPELTHSLITDCKNRVDQGAWCTGKGKAYIPAPGPYLNGEMWKDEIIPRPEFSQPVDFSEIARSTPEMKI
ncbi:MAG: Lin1244/Lin1753 domain-containing protein [Desulfobulbia bacterium]